MKHAHSEEKSSLCAFSLSVRNGMVLLLLHRDPDLGVILLVQGALGEFAGVGVHFDAVAGGEMRLPELGDRLLRPLIGEDPGAAQDGKGFLLRFAVGWILSHGRIFFSGNTAQFGKKPQPGFLAQFKVWKTKEYCMYPQGVCRIRKPAYAGNGCAIFLVFHTEEVGQKDGCGSQTQLRGVALDISCSVLSESALPPVGSDRGRLLI